MNVKSDWTAVGLGRVAGLEAEVAELERHKSTQRIILDGYMANLKGTRARVTVLEKALRRRRWLSDWMAAIKGRAVNADDKDVLAGHAWLLLQFGEQVTIERAVLTSQEEPHTHTYSNHRQDGETYRCAEPCNPASHGKPREEPTSTSAPETIAPAPEVKGGLKSEPKCKECGGSGSVQCSDAGCDTWFCVPCPSCTKGDG